MSNSNRTPNWIIVGSGLKGPSILVTSGQFLGRSSAGASFTVTYNLDGSAGSGKAPTVPGTVTAWTPPAGISGSRVPLMGGAPAGVFTVEGSSDDVYYAGLPVTVSSLFGVATSGIRLINLTGALPDYIRLKYENTSSSGIFNVAFSSHGYGSGI